MEEMIYWGSGTAPGLRTLSSLDPTSKIVPHVFYVETMVHFKEISISIFLLPRFSNIHRKLHGPAQGLPNLKCIEHLFLAFFGFGQGRVCCRSSETSSMETNRLTSRAPSKTVVSGLHNLDSISFVFSGPCLHARDTTDQTDGSGTAETTSAGR